MAVNKNPKRDRQLTHAKEVADAIGDDVIDPAILFGRANGDDLDLYTAEMLALSAIHAAAEISAWNGTQPRVTIAELEHVEPEGKATSVLCITNRNMPFLYDSVMGEVTATFRPISLAVHPILVAKPDRSVELYVPGDDSQPEDRISHIQIHVDKLSRTEADDLISRIHLVLDQVHLAVRDWPAMLNMLQTATVAMLGYGPKKRRAEKEEALDFLRWLHDNNFTFLGMREYTYTGTGDQAKLERSTGEGLGILSDPDVRVLRHGADSVTTTPEILAFLNGPDFLIVTKANVKSLIHRRAYMDYIGIKRFDESGLVIGELRIVGLFTSSAYHQAASRIPLLRGKLFKVLDQFGYDPASHSGKLLLNTLESYPRDELFQIETSLLALFCEQINDLVDRPRIRVLPRIDQFDRFISVIVYVPKERYDSELRTKIGDYLKTVYDGRVSAYYPAFPEGGVARVHFIIGRSGGKIPKFSQSKLEADIRTLATRWEERFSALAGEAEQRLEVGKDYQLLFEPKEAYADLPLILASFETKTIQISFHEVSNNPTGTRVGLKIFYPLRQLALSERVPLLENLGFRVLSEKTFDLHLRSKGEEPGLVVLHDMELEVDSGEPLAIADVRSRLEEAFLSAYSGKTDNDGFNRLVLIAGLDARQVMVLRAYARYLRQAAVPYSQDYMADTLAKYPAIACDLYSLFANRFDPSVPDRIRQKRETDLLATFDSALAAVPSLDEDRILRHYANLVLATTRTNCWQRDGAGQPKPVLVFKFDSRKIDGLPEPRPFREIFVYGTEVEGVHLRFGKVARGGLRWSDRAQDYRTEVLGLVKAQQVKNAVIVPVGAKGGFLPKKVPLNGTRDDIFQNGLAAYKTFIRMLLSVTDNLSGARIIPPANTVRHDGDDPYFVVAADKGTATFSDTANGLAQEADFWLDDAFASGGSAGYDHKKMGITARGAWEAVKRHFREMGTDIQTTPFTVAGVGDMSGDVFGNGMLLSPKIRLIAAFDHRDIFIDPDPDLATSFSERQRLFALPRSSWQDYDRKALSKGAMIVSRQEKSVILTEEAAAAIGLQTLTASPSEVISAILKCPVDLLWFGGIGTYIRAQDERDADVGDRANDAVRITGDAVQAKVIGEGANLGVTARGRIAYGLKGGRCNSDAIDNSAGVNSSDIEVNIKIALANPLRDNRLTRANRDLLLASMTDEVAALVLRNNYLQTLSISLTEREGLNNGRGLSHLMHDLEADGTLNREVEFLPDDKTMSGRYLAGKPLTRSEIAILLSYAKMDLFDRLIASALPDDPWLEEALILYFPEKMQRIYESDILNHRLRREIIATVLANHVINRGGPAFLSSMQRKTGAKAPDIVKAAIYICDGFDLAFIWNELDQLDGHLTGDIQNSLYALVADFYAHAIENTVNSKAIGDQALTSAVKALKQAIASLNQTIQSLLPASVNEDMAKREGALTDQGVSAALANRLVRLETLVSIPEIAKVSVTDQVSLTDAASHYLRVSEDYGIEKILSLGRQVRAGDPYEEQALSTCLNDITAARSLLVSSALKQSAEERLAHAQGRNMPKGNDFFKEDLKRLADQPDFSLAKIVVATGLFNQLARNAVK